MELQPPLSYQPYLDQLIAFASTEARKDELLTAKAEYFRMSGEVHEDEKSFEQRMASFLEYYVFDWKRPSTQKTPAQEFYEEQQPRLTQEEVEILRGFTTTLHALFEVRKLAEQRIRLRELFSGKDHQVTERRQIAGLSKGDILEARLIPVPGHLLFASGFCCHPREAAGLIRKEVKRRKKDKSPPQELLWECARMAQKAERYRQIAIERIYDFEHKSPLAAGKS